jgi:hypothetical protein
LAFGLQAKGGRADSGDEHGGAFAGILAIGGTPNGLGTGGRAIVLRGGGTGARMGAPLRIEPAGAIGAPAEGDREAGDIWLDGAGDLYLCVSKVPQTWSRLTAVRPRVGASQANTGGAVNFLPRPIRIKDSRIGGGSPLAAGQSLAIKVTETSIGGVQVPAGATGVLGTLTVTQTQGTGYLSVYPQGGAPPAEFATSNINWSAPGLDLATSFVSGVSGSGHLVVHNGIVAGSNPTHFLVDIAGYVI